MPLSVKVYGAVPPIAFIVTLPFEPPPEGCVLTVTEVVIAHAVDDHVNVEASLNVPIEAAMLSLPALVPVKQNCATPLALVVEKPELGFTPVTLKSTRTPTTGLLNWSLTV